MIATLFSQRFSLLLVVAMVFCYAPFSYAVAPARVLAKPAAAATPTPTPTPTPTSTSAPAASASAPQAPVVASVPAEVVAQVIWVQGEMKAAQPNKAPRVLQRRSAIYEHDVITTNASGTGQIAFTDGSTYALRTDTEFKIDGYHYSKDGPPKEEKSIVSLVKGGFRTITGAIPKQNPDGYQVNSPVATIGVRGTDYTAFLSKGNGMFLEINKGTIDVVNQAGKMILSRCAISTNCQYYGNVSDFRIAPKPLPKVPRELAGQPSLAPVPPKTIESISSSSIPAPAASAPAPAAGNSSSSSGSSTSGSSTGSTGSDSGGGSSTGSTGGGSSGGSSTGSAGGDSSSSSSNGPTIGGPDTGDSGTANTSGGGASTGGSTTITVTPPSGSSAPKPVSGFCVGMLGTALGKSIC